MSWKSFFKALGKGALSVAEIALPVIAGLALSPAATLVARTLIDSIHFAEENWPAQGSGAEKGAFVSKVTLEAMEAVTGKNINNPETRALVDEIRDTYVAAMNMLTKVRELVVKLNDAIKHAKDPAINDAP